jgi:hypothetical protein
MRCLMEGRSDCISYCWATDFGHGVQALGVPGPWNQKQEPVTAADVSERIGMTERTRTQTRRSLSIP